MRWYRRAEADDGHGGILRGRVDAIRLSNMGYQVTRIDGRDFVTWFDYKELPGMGVGAVVEYETSGIDVTTLSAQVSINAPSAKILRVVSRPSNEGDDA